MAEPVLSVITPSYNQAEFIEENIQSVRNLASDDVEHIVVDGDSNDDTVSILKSHESDYDLRWVSEPDDGQSHAINKGIEMAEGQFIGWLNADDYYLPGAFDAFDEVRRKHPETDVIYGDFVFVDESGAELSPKYHTRPSRFVHKHWQNYTANHCTFFNSRVLAELGGVREDLEYVMDIDLLWRIITEGYSLRHTPSFIAARRLHAGAKTVGDESERNSIEKQLLDDMYGRSTVERAVPDKLLTVGAFTLQSVLYARERHWGALRHSVTSVMK